MADNVEFEALQHAVASGGAVGIAAGIYSQGGARSSFHGRTAAQGAAVGPSTDFELASITKVFTALLLADMVEWGEVAADDPVAALLPAGAASPAAGAVTLRQLVTHRAGLPRMPDNMFLPEEKNGVSYAAEDLYAYLSTCALVRPAGAQYEYSNLGFGLLAHALSLRLGMTFAHALEQRIFAPLGMKDTGWSFDPRWPPLLPGHGKQLEPLPNIQMGVLAGAGGLRATAGDMLRFLASNMDDDSPLAVPLRRIREERADTTMPGVTIGWGWHISQRVEQEIIWHNGGSGGYRSFAGIDLQSRAGAVILSNTFGVFDVDRWGSDALDRNHGNIPPAPAP